MENSFEKLMQKNTFPVNNFGLPGVDNSKIIPSEPMLVREDFKERKPRPNRKSKRWNILKFFGWD